MENNRVCILDTIIDNMTMEETVDSVKKYIEENKPLHLMGVNADKINMLQTNARLKKIVNECGIINADGASVIWASKVLKKKLPERVAGIDLMQKLVMLAEENEYRVYFLGAKQEIVEKTVEVLKNRHPNLKIAGFRNGYFGDDEWSNVTETIRDCIPQIVFVGITSPKKEYLVEYMQTQGLTSVFMGVGGSFDVISGAIPRAPLWMQRLNLEWLFRVLQEPRRLFKRYFVGNWKFTFDVYREKRKKG